MDAKVIPFEGRSGCGVGADAASRSVHPNTATRADPWTTEYERQAAYVEHLTDEHASDERARFEATTPRPRCWSCHMAASVQRPDRPEVYCFRCAAEILGGTCMVDGFEAALS